MKSLKSLFSVSLSLAGLFTLSSLQAATITPNILTDPAIGSDSSNCSLRYAVEAINLGSNATVPGCAVVGTFGTDDTVVLGTGPYILTLSGDENNNQTGDLDVLANMAITGAGPDATIIDASGNGGDRAIELTDNPSEVLISGVTITGADTDDAGGGILTDVDGLLTIDNSRIIGNSASNGGGIYFDFNTSALLNNVTIDDNDSGGCGGGIFMIIATVGIANSTISNNDSTDSDGGGICQAGDELFLTNTTISGNTATNDGGGIWTDFEGSTGGIKGMYNVTVAFNQAGISGGGIAGDIQTAPAGNGPIFPIRIFNSIIAQNTAQDTGNDCANGNFLTGGFNLIGEIEPGDNCQDFVDGVNGDQVGTAAAPIDPLLGPLADNGGPTLTHALLVGSPAIDQANPNGCEAADVAQFIDDGTQTFSVLTTDQRGEPRPVAILDPAVPICDIGAFEVQPTPTPTPTPIITPTPTPTPPFQGFVEGSGCSLVQFGSAMQGAAAWPVLAIFSTWAFRRLRRRAK